MLHKSFKPAKCKTALNLAKSRIKLMKNKKEIQVKQMRRELAQLLDSGQDQTARIRVEHVVREEKMMAAYEMIELYCELVVARLPIIESQKNCPLDLKEAIASLIFAAPRCGDITELQDVRKHFASKYGKDFASAAVELRPNCGVSRILVEKLSVNSPDGPTKVKILTAIAEEHNVKWEPNWFKEDPEPTIDIPKVAAKHSVESSSIQMQPLNFEIADDLEEKHAHDTGRPGTSTQSQIRTSNDLISSSSTSRLDARHSEFSLEKTVSSQSSRTAESASNNGRQKWNMQFKDATAAAQAAAESAELASIAARAAAELSSRSNVMYESSSGPRISSARDQSENNYHNSGTGPQRSYVHQNSSGSSFNQRVSKPQNQGEANRQGDMTEGGDALYSHKDEQYEAGKQVFNERKSSTRYARDSDSSPIVSEVEPNTFRSLNFHDYEIESSENPFYEETLERENQPGSLHSQSSTFGDEHGVFSNLNNNEYKNDSGDGSFGRFSRNIANEEDWNVHNAGTYGEGDITFQNHKKGNRVLESDEDDKNDSGSDPFFGTEHRTSGKYNDVKDIRTNSVVFDESGSDDDDDHVLYPDEEHNFPSSKLTHKVSSLSEDNPHFEPDISKSFRSSSLYSKLLEPLPMVFDDSDKESSENEKEQQREKFDPEVLRYDYRKPDADHNFEQLRSSYVGKGSGDSFKTSKHVDDNQNAYPGSGSKHKSDYDDNDAPSFYDQTSSEVVSSDFNSRSDYGLSNKGEPQNSLHSLRLSEPQLPVSESKYETQPQSESGMELDLKSLPGGRRNRAQWRIPRGGLADASSPSRSTAPPTSGSNEKASLESFSQAENKQVSMKKGGLYTEYDLPRDDIEVESTKDSDNAKGPYRSSRLGKGQKTSPKDPTGFFDSNDSDPEEDVPKHVAQKTFVGVGVSRRTKTSSPRSVASPRTSVVAAAKIGKSSHSYAPEISNSRMIVQSSSDDEGTTFVESVDKKASRNDRSSFSSVAQKPMTTKSADAVGATDTNEKAPSRENSAKLPSHVHPKLPDFETFTAHLQSLRKNRK